MPFPIEQKLVVAVSSTALFDLSREDELYRTLGLDEFREFQRKNRSNVPKPGAAFPFVERLLNLNNIYDEEQPIEVVILSKNHADAGLRMMDALSHYGLNISRCFFTAGEQPFKYIESLDAVLYLSTDKDEVKNAVKNGYPAGYILPCETTPVNDNSPLKIALDFDGIIANDEAESIYKNTGKLEAFHKHENVLKGVPLPPGPLMQLLLKISKFQKLERKKAETMGEYTQMLQISIVTARNAPAHERVITTLSDAGIDVDGIFMMGGIDKLRVLKVIKPHIFIDDQITHLENVAEIIPCVHVPFGIANLDEGDEEPTSEFKKATTDSFPLNEEGIKLNDKQISHKVDLLKKLIWKHKGEIWSDSDSLEPLQMLDPAEILRQLGYKIVESSSLGTFEQSGKSYEVSAQIDRECNVIEVSSQEPVVSRNFTLAHELGHALMHAQTGLHRDPKPKDRNSFKRVSVEREADKFAALFLMPGKLVRQEFERIFLVDKFTLNDDRLYALNPSNDNKINEQIKTQFGLAKLLAKKDNYNRHGQTPIQSLVEIFNVSVEAMAIRLIELDLV